MRIDLSVTAEALATQAQRVVELGGKKARKLASSRDFSRGTPVFTVEGKYATRGWTEWTQGFQYGCAILAFEETGDDELLRLGRDATVRHMSSHVTHVGVHDHGFNNISTYGNLRRLMREGKIPHNEWEMCFYEMALRASGAVQAMRWSDAEKGGGYIYSFNGPHSLFIDTMRTLRVLGLAHQLGHSLMGENDRRISLLERLVRHGITSATHNVFYGDGRDAYDVRGRVAHEAIFNRNDGVFRCVNSQQGYSPFSTWTRGLAWAMLGFAEELEFLSTLADDELKNKRETLEIFDKAASATCDFYIDHATALDGIPYWDTGAPELHRIENWRDRDADPMNDHEPVDSSAAAIAAQGLIRYGTYLGKRCDRYVKAGLTVARRVMEEPYLSVADAHEGLLLHSAYHVPRGWDHVPPGAKRPRGESSMWGDYHLLELAVMISRLSRGQAYPVFFDR